MFHLNGKTAIVTGASRGIGRAIAIALASRGAHVFVNCRSRDNEANHVVDQIRGGGGLADVAVFDVSNSVAVDSAIASVVKTTQRLDIVVANAGVCKDGLLMRANDDDLDVMVRTNLFGSMALARSAIKPMLRARTGRIVFVSSVVGEMGNAGQSLYAASKAALLGLMKSLSKELGSRSITVNAVAPGFVETEMTSRIGDDARRKIIERIPLGRFGQAEEVASAVLFLCSDEAAYVSGQTLRVNGGMFV